MLTEPCLWCEGTGKVARVAFGENPAEVIELDREPIPVVGAILTVRCRKCGGTGRVAIATEADR